MPAPKLTERDLDALAEMRERGRTKSRIAQSLGVSEGAVAWRCLRLGIEPPNPKPVKPVPIEPVVIRRGAHVVRRFTQAEDQQLRALEAQGLMPAQIARRLDRRINVVVARLATLARHEARSEISA